MGGSRCEFEQSFEGNEDRATWIFFFFFFKEKSIPVRTACANGLRQECFYVSWGRDQRGTNRTLWRLHLAGEVGNVQGELKVEQQQQTEALGVIRRREGSKGADSALAL